MLDDAPSKSPFVLVEQNYVCRSLWNPSPLRTVGKLFPGTCPYVMSDQTSPPSSSWNEVQKIAYGRTISQYIRPNIT